MIDIYLIAMLCHEANRAICVASGDHSQVPWEEAPGWQQDSALKGVEFVLANSDAGPDALHNAWMADKIADGWVFGDVKDAALKTHPCIVPHDQLPFEQKVKDYVFGAIVRSMK